MKKNRPKVSVYLQKQVKMSHIPSKQQFEHWAQAALIKKKTPVEVTLRIVDSAESAQLNEKYRHKKGPTNVLSFTYSPIPGADHDSMGDLVLCADLVKQEAHCEHKTIVSHWAHLLIHGLLHLQGYDHEQPDEAKVMETLETKIMEKLGFPNPYLEMAKG